MKYRRKSDAQSLRVVYYPLFGGFLITLAAVFVCAMPMLIPPSVFLTLVSCVLAVFIF